MAKTYTCFIHKSGGTVPDLRIVVCASDADLPEAIGAELHIWGAFEKIEIYDDGNRPVFSYPYMMLATH